MCRSTIVNMREKESTSFGCNKVREKWRWKAERMVGALVGVGEREKSGAR